MIGGNVGVMPILYFPIDPFQASTSFIHQLFSHVFGIDDFAQ